MSRRLSFRNLHRVLQFRGRDTQQGVQGAEERAEQVVRLAKHNVSPHSDVSICFLVYKFMNSLV